MGFQRYNKKEQKRAKDKHVKLHTPAKISTKKSVIGKGKKAGK